MYIFNQYYFALVKKTRNVAKKIKDKSSVAKDILKQIRAHYNTFENNSSEYATFFSNEFSKDLFQPLIDTDDPSEWIQHNHEKEVFKHISLQMLSRLFKDNTILHQFLLILHMFRDTELSEEDSKNIVQKMKGIDNEDLEIVDKYKETVQKIIQLNIKSQAGFNMKDIEDTSIGKLAKDIVEDLDLDKIKQSVKKNGDILSALGDPENGIGNLIGDVSSKMAKKIKSGEIKQDDLLKDALNMGSKLPMFGGGDANSDKGDPFGMGGSSGMGNIMQMMQGMQGMMGKNMGDINKAMKSNKFKNMEKQMKQKERMKSKLNKKQTDTDTVDEVTKGLEQLSMERKLTATPNDELTDELEKLKL